MKVLFQGDSITDAGRWQHEDPKSLGAGYPLLIAGDYAAVHPEYEFLNAAVSGDRVVDLLARWKRDCLNLRPDVVSILVGVNDVWHELSHQNGVHAALFENVYDTLLEETIRVLPDVKLLLLGAYALHGPATDQAWEYFSTEVKTRRDIAKAHADKYGCAFLDLQAVLEASGFPAEQLSPDGVHPTLLGHRVIADAWKARFRELIG